VWLTGDRHFAGLAWPDVVLLERHEDVPGKLEPTKAQLADIGTALKVLMADESNGFIAEYMTTSFDDDGVL